jgi:hypothetical protein
MTSSNEDIAPAGESANVPNGLNKERREALRRIGKYGAYTAPALLAMLASAAAIPVTAGGGCT